MSENMSQNTEGDFLDQTFKDIDSSVSLEETEDPGAQNNNEKPADKKGGLSSNTILLAGGVAGALALTGYWFLTAGGQPQPQAEPPVASQEPTPEQPPISFNEPAPQQAAPVAEVPVAPPVPAVDPLAIAPAPVADPLLAATPVDPFAPAQPAGQVPTQNISSVVMPEPLPQLSEPVAPVANEALNSEVNSVLQGATAQPAQQTTQAPIQAPAQVVDPIQSITSNAPQTAHVDELRSLFDKHSVEIDKLDIRVTALEAKFDKSVQEQMSINKRVEERLAKLEAGGVSKASSNSSSNSASSGKSTQGSNVVKNTQRKRVKKASTQKSTTTSKVTVSNEPSLESTTLVDKRDVVSTAKPKQESIDIHSVFSGRLWIKNSDSTLSTFAVGEAIPGGEKIKRIDELGRKIYTDKRVVSY